MVRVAGLVRLLLWGVLVAVVAVGVKGHVDFVTQPAISRAAAEEVLQAAVRAAEAEDYATLCHDVAASVNMCRGMLEEVVERGVGLDPGPGAPQVIEEGPMPHGGIRLRVRGVGADGKAYETDFMVVRHDGEPRTMVAVYWNGTQMG